DWRDAAAKASRNDQVALLTHMPVSEAIAVTRRHDRRPAEQPHLAAMRVPAQYERHARGNARQDVRLVRKQNDRLAIFRFAQRRREIVDADAQTRIVA